MSHFPHDTQSEISAIAHLRITQPSPNRVRLGAQKKYLPDRDPSIQGGKNCDFTRGLRALRLGKGHPESTGWLEVNENGCDRGRLSRLTLVQWCRDLRTEFEAPQVPRTMDEVPRR